MHQLTQLHKKNICQCFNKAANTYDDHSSTQQHAGKKLISLLLNDCRRADRMIDLGCGTGTTTEQLAKRIHYQHFHAIDIADQLLAKTECRLSAYGLIHG